MHVFYMHVIRNEDKASCAKQFHPLLILLAMTVPVLNLEGRSDRTDKTCY